MRKSILASFAVLFAAVVAVGCKREVPTPTPTPTPTPKEYVYDIYVSGNSISASGVERALLWENDQLKKLSTRESWAGTVSGSGTMSTWQGQLNANLRRKDGLPQFGKILRLQCWIIVVIHPSTMLAPSLSLVTTSM